MPKSRTKPETWTTNFRNLNPTPPPQTPKPKSPEAPTPHVEALIAGISTSSLTSGVATKYRTLPTETRNLIVKASTIYIHTSIHACIHTYIYMYQLRRVALVESRILVVNPKPVNPLRVPAPPLLSLPLPPRPLQCDLRSHQQGKLAKWKLGSFLNQGPLLGLEYSTLPARRHRAGVGGRECSKHKPQTPNPQTLSLKALKPRPLVKNKTLITLHHKLKTANTNPKP